MNEKLCYFHLTDLNEQIFSALINIQNIYSLQSSHYVLMTKTLTITVESMKIWHCHLNHLHIDEIIQLFKNSWINVKIKDTQTLLFCKACKLVNLKKKLFIEIMTRSQRCKNKLHFDIDDDDETLNKSDQLSQFFLSCKYFFIIINDIIRMRWDFLMKSRNKTYDILKYFLKQLKNQNIKLFIIWQDDSVREFDFKQMKKLQINHSIAWKFCVSYSQNQNDIVERSIKIILFKVWVLMIQISLSEKF